MGLRAGRFGEDERPGADGGVCRCFLRVPGRPREWSFKYPSLRQQACRPHQSAGARRQMAVEMLSDSLQRRKIDASQGVRLSDCAQCVLVGSQSSALEQQARRWEAVETGASASAHGPRRWPVVGIFFFLLVVGTCQKLTHRLLLLTSPLQVRQGNSVFGAKYLRTVRL